MDGDVDVLERWRGGRRCSDREAKTVGLIEVMVWVLTDNDCFDGIKRCMSRPVDINFSSNPQ